MQTILKVIIWQIYSAQDIIVAQMYEQEDSCIEQEDLMTEYIIYPECENKILFRVAPSSRRYRPDIRSRW